MDITRKSRTEREAENALCHADFCCSNAHAIYKPLFTFFAYTRSRAHTCAPICLFITEQVNYNLYAHLLPSVRIKYGLVFLSNFITAKFSGAVFFK